MNLHEAHEGVTGHRRTKRLGRGRGSGHGKTASRGHKGQRSRSGTPPRPTFEGGQMPLARRIPKRGFNNRWRKVYAVVNVEALEETFADGADIDPAAMKAVGLAKGRYDGIKILGDGSLTKKFHITAHGFSRAAREKIQGAGGTATVV